MYFRMRSLSNDKDNIGEQNEVKINCNSIMPFLGNLGIHRFYLGYTLIGVIQLLTFGGILIWAIVDFIRLIKCSLNDSEGNGLV